MRSRASVLHLVGSYGVLDAATAADDVTYRIDMNDVGDALDDAIDAGDAELVVADGTSFIIACGNAQARVQRSTSGKYHILWYVYIRAISMQF